MQHDDRSARQERGGEHRPGLVDFTRSITLMETIGRVENDMAETLRVMAARDGTERAARRLQLAEDAERRAHAAARASERLQEQADQLAGHTVVVPPHQALNRGTAAPASPDRVESDLAGTLTDLASYSSPDAAVRWRRLAAETSAAALHARDRAHAVQPLAQTDAAHPQGSGAAAEKSPASPVRSPHQRLGGVERRRTELQQARPGPPEGDTAPQVVAEAHRRAREGDWLWQESVAHLRQARQLAEQAICLAAAAHDRAAEAHERSARAGIGDGAEHNRMAASHRAAANADRQRAQEIHSQVVDPGPSH